MNCMPGLKYRKTEMFLEIDDDVQEEAAKVLERFPRLVGLKKQDASLPIRSLSPSRGFGIMPFITEEKPTGNDRKPNIPDVCAFFGVECKNLLDLIRGEKWIVG